FSHWQNIPEKFQDLIVGTKLFTKNIQKLKVGFALSRDSDEKKGKFGLQPKYWQWKHRNKL
ncbi:23717_t:CDS:1, partial [Gigaspora rosea]